MANVGSSLPPFRGPWVDGTEYVQGDLVTRAGALWQARTDTSAQPGGTSAVAGRGNPASWLDVSSLVLQMTGSIDPTTGAGIPSAVGTTYQRAGTGLLTKTGSGATAWETPGGGSFTKVAYINPEDATPQSLAEGMIVAGQMDGPP